MCTPCRPGEPAKWYKWCRCMQSCGPVERVYEAYDKRNINGLHLLAELYDDDDNPNKCRLYKRWRTTWLTEDYWSNRRHWILYPQFPYGDGVRSTNSIRHWKDYVKADYDNYLEGRGFDITWEDMQKRDRDEYEERLRREASGGTAEGR